ncbi:ATP-dependent helicase [Candidatus Berkelbacteria bacterium]|nr:ATP-dependent helicase [Candidatus Berkelbacteria bacterium]
MATTTTQSQLLKGLNGEQYQAVTHGKGPLLVVAGAGTGKTKVLTHRIAWLVEQKLAKPEEILALTFTEKAAGEMESRADQLLPLGQTGATIETFHAFGDQFLRENALDLGLPPEFRVLGSTEQEIFLSERIDQIEGLDALRPVSSSRKFISSILRTISRAKDELVTPLKYLEVTKQLLDAAQDDEQRQEAKRQYELAIIYQAYEDYKASSGVVDFGDQILMLIKLFKHHPKKLRQLQSQFKFVLVDEFQDTNIGQYQLVKLLASKHSNLTVVGDDDQAIYKFRGAAVSNILQFIKDYPETSKVVLTQNYRSSQQILDCSYRLIKHNNPDRLEAELKINKQLEAQFNSKQPIFTWYEHEADELNDLVQKIKAETCTLSDIAILVRSNSQMSAITRQLRLADINYQVSSDRDFIAKPEIQGVIAFFEALVDPYNSLALMKLAFSPYYQFEPDWLLQINSLARKNNSSFEEIISAKSSIVWQRLSAAGQKSAEQLADNLASYRKLIGKKNPGEILYQFLKDRGVLERFKNQGQGQAQLFKDIPDNRALEIVQNLSAIFEAISGYLEASRDPFALSFVTNLQELLSQVTPPSTNVGPDTEAINLMTIHASKGLEFEVVFLPGLTNDRFPARAKHDPLPLPDQLIVEALPTGDERIQEERRLAYVAITRAKQKLILSAPQFAGTAKRAKKISRFINEAIDLPTTITPIKKVGATEKIKTFKPVVPVPTKAQFPIYNGVIFLTPAMIDCYNNDPYDFYWKYVLKSPSPASSHLIYGTAVHAAIESYYRGKINQKPLTVDKVIQRFSEAWKNEGFDSAEEANRRFEAGIRTVKNFYDRAEQSPIPEQVEETFLLNLGDIRIRGRIDALYTKSGEVVDFKTSNVKDQKDADRKIKANLPVRIYALAYLKRFGRLPQKVTLDFVEANLKASLQISQEVIDSTEQLIRDTATNIKAGHFPPNPNNPFKDY